MEILSNFIFIILRKAGHTRTHGFNGLGILSNSVLEHFHQEGGKPAFKACWVAAQAAFQSLGRKYAASDPAATPG